MSLIQPQATANDRGFTGCRHNDELGLIYMNARYYLPAIGRFLTPDTLVPDPANPQSFNRYAYVRNNPINRIDPTGHVDCHLLDGGADTVGCIRGKIPAGTMITFTGAWDNSHEDLEKQQGILEGAEILGQAFANVLNQQYSGLNLSAQEAFLYVFGGAVEFQHQGTTCATGCGAWTQTSRQVFVYDKDIANEDSWAIHELGHAFDKAIGGRGTQAVTVAQRDNSFPNREPDETGLVPYDQTWGFAGPIASPRMWQHSDQPTASEEFADMTVGYAYNTWETFKAPDGTNHLTNAGRSRSSLMVNNMASWLDIVANR